MSAEVQRTSSPPSIVFSSTLVTLLARAEPPDALAAALGVMANRAAVAMAAIGIVRIREE